MKTFDSSLQALGKFTFPLFSNVRIQMMPIELGDMESVPYFLKWLWYPAIARLFELSPIKKGVGYLTIDERFTKAGETHRRPGLHVDGIGLWGDGGGAWGAQGFLTVSSHAGCEAYHQEFHGSPIGVEQSVDPIIEGNCEHLRLQCHGKLRLIPNLVYWMNSLCVHESVPLEQDTSRTFVRLSMPSACAPYEGFTENPTGVKPLLAPLPMRTLPGRFAYAARNVEV